MKIVINARLLRKNKMDGIGWFTFNTIKYLIKTYPNVTFHLLFDSGIENFFGREEKNVVFHNLFPPAKHALLNIIWFECTVHKVLKKINPDLFLSPDGILCLRWSGKQYAVIHDINFFHIPKDLKWSNRVYYNYFFPKYAKKSIRIATVSQYSKTDIVTNFGVDGDKIDVVYNGINAMYTPVTKDIKTLIQKTYAKGKAYFLFVGTLHPRKNIIRLLQAFNLFKKETNADVCLLLVGREMYRTEEMHACREQLEYKEDIIFTGRVDDEVLKLIVGSALCLTFIPYFEGFGIPPIEAMECNVPVIASNVTSIPEVVGDAGILVDPFNINDIKNAMVSMLKEDVRNELISKGNIQKEKFSWEKTAMLLSSSIMKALHLN